MSDIQYPDVTVRLVGEDGNAFSVIGRVSRALKRAGYPEAAAEFQAQAFDCRDYDELLRLCTTTVMVE